MVVKNGVDIDVQQTLPSARLPLCSYKDEAVAT